MTFRIEADALHRIVYNSLLFDTKSAKAYRVGGPVDPVFYLHMNTSDGQVYLEDQAEVKTLESDQYFIISAEESKVWEKDLRDAEGVIKCELKGSYLYCSPLRPAEGGTVGYTVSAGEYAQQSELFDYDSFDPCWGAPFAINPDRVRKLALLQPRDYPVECELREVDGIPTPVLFFTKGPSVRGTYATLKRP